ncbi:MAG TPA: hypothetical protein PKY31_09210 [Spirochaetota bacterium]|nr:hypothetical protein [Spirochaetota bacterium]
MFDWIHTLPVWCAKAGAVLIFGGVIFFTWTLPRDFLYLGAPDTARWRDLRIWATVLLAFQFLIYMVF